VVSTTSSLREVVFPWEGGRARTNGAAPARAFGELSVRGWRRGATFMALVWTAFGWSPFEVATGVRFTGRCRRPICRLGQSS
jgi:hypothetical protein